MTHRHRAQRASIHDIAQSAGVSPATVSRVFNTPDLVSEPTRALVHSAAHQLGYRPNASARTLRTHKSQVLGVVLPTLTNPVFAECLQGIAQAAAAAGYAIMPHTTDYHLAREQACVADLQAAGVDAMILVVSDASNSPALAQLQAGQLPYALAYNQHPGHPCVSVAGELAMSAVVEHLVELGHRRIAMVCGQLKASDRAQQRYAGFLSAMQRAALSPLPLVEVPFVATAIDEIVRHLTRAERPTALVCSNDLIAIRAMRAAHQCGLHVPRDISVTGFDGIGLGPDLTPALSTISQPNVDIGRRCVEMLVHALADHTLPDAGSSLLLPYRFHAGESCGPVS